MARSAKEQRDALKEYQDNLASSKRLGGETAQQQYERMKKKYQEKVWKEANR